MIDFPANPTLGQQFTAAGVTWTWDGVKWTSGGQSVAYLPLAGGTMLGPIVLAADPAAPLQPATKQYVDGGRLGDNRIINGNFAINQRGYVSGNALAAAAYGHDRWKAGASGCTYTFTTTVPDTTITITAGTLTQVIEAGMIEGGVYTLSWSGTAQARVYQGTPTGAYAASPFTTAALPAGVNTIVEFNAGTLVRAKLEIGSVATPFNRQSMAKNLADCQRYYQIGQVAFTGYSTSPNSPLFSMNFLVQMRASPTLTVTTNNCTNMGVPSLGQLTPAGSDLYIQAAITATGGYTLGALYSASAEL